MLLLGGRAIITGAGTGIGRATALELVREGADVHVTDLDVRAAEETASEAAGVRSGARISHGRLDVRDRDEVTHELERAGQLLGGLSMAVNNAGVSSMAPVVDLTEEDWDFNMDVNAKGVFLCCQAELRSMVAREEQASIVNIASMAGKVGLPLLAHYSASKFAVIGFTQALAREVAGRGIRVNAVCPGYVRTGMQAREVQWEARLRNIAPATVYEEYRQAVPLGRLEEPVDVAHVVVFLLSARAAYITGHALNVTGGALLG